MYPGSFGGEGRAASLDFEIGNESIQRTGAFALRSVATLSPSEEGSSSPPIKVKIIVKRNKPECSPANPSSIVRDSRLR